MLLLFMLRGQCLLASLNYFGQLRELLRLQLLSKLNTMLLLLLRTAFKQDCVLRCCSARRRTQGRL